MALPRIRFAFGFFGDLRLSCLAIFIFLLAVSAYFSNKYLGMYIHSRVLSQNTGNLSRIAVDERMKIYITVSEKGSFLIGSLAAIYLIASIYGLVAIIVNEIHILITPMILLPFAAFIMLVLLFFDLGIQESAGFFHFWVFSGIVIKIVIAVASGYFFIVVYSYYMESTRESSSPEGKISRPLPKWFPKLSSRERETTPPTSPSRSPPRTRSPESPRNRSPESPRNYSPEKKITTPTRPPPPKLKPIKPFSPRSPPRGKSTR